MYSGLTPKSFACSLYGNLIQVLDLGACSYDLQIPRLFVPVKGPSHTNTMQMIPFQVFCNWIVSSFEPSGQFNCSSAVVGISSISTVEYSLLLSRHLLRAWLIDGLIVSGWGWHCLGGWDFLPVRRREKRILQSRSRIGGSAWIALQNGRNLSKYSIY